MAFTYESGTPATLRGTDGNDVLIQVDNNTGASALSATRVEALEGNDSMSVTQTGGLGVINEWSIFGGEGNDTVSLLGSPTATLVQGGQGNDSVSVNSVGNIGGGAIDSSIRGGAGNDTIRIVTTGIGSVGTTYQGGSGTDQLFAQGVFQNANIRGGGDEDTIWFTADSSLSNTSVTGGADADYITNEDQTPGVTTRYQVIAESSTIFGGGAGDVIDFATNETDLLIYGDTGASNSETDAATADGADQIFGGDGEDTIYGEGGNDTIFGNAGDDTIVGGDGADSLFGNAGDDTITGNDGADYIEGNADDDVIDGGSGNDTILGGANEDYIFGDAGADSLFGNEADDTILGGTGDDTIFGGTDADLLTGGTGSDVFGYTFGDTALSSIATATSATAAYGVGISNSLGASITNTTSGVALVQNTVTGFDEITDYVSGTDSIDNAIAVTFAAQGAGTVAKAVMGTNGRATFVGVSDQTFAGRINAVDAALPAAGNAAVFDGGDGFNYLYIQAAVNTSGLAAVSSDDILVRLDGVTIANNGITVNGSGNITNIS